jgi:anion-transporting  ArsA/GET3 family ATPase
VNLQGLVRDRRVLVICGAGGVGKTTVSAALALSAARLGRRSLVLTIDPAKRLAEALGIPPTGSEPSRIDESRLASCGITLPEAGALSAWMLDPRVVLERVVDRFAPTPQDAAQIRSTRLYQTLVDVMVGLQEYTAAEALFSFSEEGRYDLIVLDTPPSRNALDFLDAPRRLARFLDRRTLAVFAPDSSLRGNPVLRAAAKVVHTALSRAFGEAFASDLQTFLGAFGKLFDRMRVHAEGVRGLLRSSDAGFVVVTSPDKEAVEEAQFFRRRIHELGLETEGYVLNRSYAAETGQTHPMALLEDRDDADTVLFRAIEKLVPLADSEIRRAQADQEVFRRLSVEARPGTGAGVFALPYLDQVVEDLAALKILSDWILRPTGGVD